MQNTLKNTCIRRIHVFYIDLGSVSYFFIGTAMYRNRNRNRRWVTYMKNATTYLLTYLLIRTYTVSGNGRVPNWLVSFFSLRRFQKIYLRRVQSRAAPCSNFLCTAVSVAFLAFSPCSKPVRRPALFCTLAVHHEYLPWPAEGSVMEEHAAAEAHSLPDLL